MREDWFSDFARPVFIKAEDWKNVLISVTAPYWELASPYVSPYLESATPYLAPISDSVNATRVSVNQFLSHFSPLQVVVATIFFVFLISRLWRFLFGSDESMWVRVKKSFFAVIRRLPIVGGLIKNEMAKTVSSMEEEMRANVNIPYFKQLPSKGLGKKGVEDMVREYESMCRVDWQSGHVSGAVYGAINQELCDLAGQVYVQHMWTNPLHPDLFPNIRKMEAEVVRMTLSMFNGDELSCGTMSTGGTESIMLAVYAYRNRAKEELGITKPEIIVPHTVHAAFDKACHCFGVKIVHIDEDPVTRRVDVTKMKRSINSNTILLVGSAPQFPHGSLDPISEIASLGERYGISVHVDACLGGFIIPFMEEAGYPMPIFDFRLPGVTSISADTHKYGYAPKGSSVIMYRDPDIRRYQYFVCVDWPGGIYATPTFGGSRAGAVIASCWASLMYTGRDGYVESTRKIIQCRERIVEGLKEVDGIHIEGVPEVSIVAVGSDHFNIFRLSTAMVEKGWSLNPLQFPPCFHICLTLMHTQEGVVEKFLDDIKVCTAEIMLDPKLPVGGAGAIYGMASTIPDRSMVSEIVTAFLDATYSTRDKGDDPDG